MLHTMRYKYCHECQKPLNQYQQKYCTDKCRRAKYYKKSKPLLSEREKFLRNKIVGYRNRATRKGLKFDLSVDQLDKLLNEPCAYCGQTAGTIDRKDNNVGYVFSNCLPACSRCNTVKCHHLTYEQMKQVAEMFF